MSGTDLCPTCSACTNESLKANRTRNIFRSYVDTATANHPFATFPKHTYGSCISAAETTFANGCSDSCSS